jgi:D-arabinono-1,4-lactone oxidase
MDSLIQRELTRVDPHIPFRAVTTHQHSTWARTYHSRPELYLQPESTEELQKIVVLARRCRKRLVVVGSGHSPSDLTCTSSWMVNLDKLDQVISINPPNKIVTVQAGIRLRDLCRALKDQGLAMPNLGSINEQSIAGAFTTGTHGSSLKHGILARSVLSLKIMLANGHTVSCSAEQNKDLFRAALVSLGAIGIIIEVTIKVAADFNIAWSQKLVPLENILATWDSNLWTEKEFVRVWWFPYMKQCVKWEADKTHEPLRAAKASWFNGVAGYYIYHTLLYVAQWFPRILPAMEWLVIRVQYGGNTVSAVEDGSQGLLMNCLYSQFVNEWAIPLEKGPEAITRLSAWIHGDRDGSGIPFDPKNLYVHAPVEVRVANDVGSQIRAYLDNTMPDGPSLLLNATLYRPYDLDPPSHIRYYQAFEWLMKDLGGRPHWAKNFTEVSVKDVQDMYPELDEWKRIRSEVDPEGMFLGNWHRRLLFDADEQDALTLAEQETKTEPKAGGGIMWYGKVPSRTLSPQNSEESFDLMHGAEAEKSIMIDDE